jgi:hypothetical protein
MPTESEPPQLFWEKPKALGATPRLGVVSTRVWLSGADELKLMFCWLPAFWAELREPDVEFDAEPAVEVELLLFVLLFPLKF